MRIYVAGRTTSLPKVHKVQACVRGWGHSITFDWTHNVNQCRLHPELLHDKEFRHLCAVQDIEGVHDADVVVAVADPGWLGTAIEVGYAIAKNTPVIIYGDTRECVFWELSNIHIIEPDPTKLRLMLNEITPRR